MEDYDREIQFLKDLKKRVEEEAFSSGDELEEDFYLSISRTWQDVDNEFTDDMTRAFGVNKFLIDQVYRLHMDEEDDLNHKKFKTNLSIKPIASKLSDGKRAVNIYSLNDEGYSYYLIGDIHSDTISLRRILDKTDFFNQLVNKKKIRLVFLGDYVDRGKKHLEALQIVLTLKYLFPDKVFLLRGNHDGGDFKDGRFRSWVRIPEKADRNDWFFEYLYNLIDANSSLDQELLDAYIKLFDSLGRISFIKTNGRTVLATHAGIPRYRKDQEEYYYFLHSLADLTDARIKDAIDRDVVSNIQWSDPGNEGDDLREEVARFRFLEEHFQEFKDKVGFDLFVRGHQAEHEGFKKFYDDSLITIFSSGKIYEEDKNINDETAYPKVDPKVLYLNHEGQLDIVDLNKR